MSEFDSPIRNASHAPDALQVYRSTLSQVPENSVTLVAIGFATTMLELLESPGDIWSPLSGKELVNKKLKKLIYMGGREDFHHVEWDNPLSYTDPVEWNFGACAPLRGATPRSPCPLLRSRRRVLVQVVVEEAVERDTISWARSLLAPSSLGRGRCPSSSLGSSREWMCTLALF